MEFQIKNRNLIIHINFHGVEHDEYFVDKFILYMEEMCNIDPYIPYFESPFYMQFKNILYEHNEHIVEINRHGANHRIIMNINSTHDAETMVLESLNNLLVVLKLTA